MNFGIVFYIISWILRFEAAFLLLPCIVGLCYGEFRASLSFLGTALLCFLVGSILGLKKNKRTQLYTRDGFLIVALSWIVISLFGCIPFILSGDIPNFTDALFETISGFTTTGASILSDVESLSKAGLFWRSFTHWVGGMGVFVFVMAILPLMGGSTMNLMKAESTGPAVSKLLPKVRDTAKVLYGIYIGITVIEVILLVCCKVSLFDALTTTFGTVGTGGFGIYNSSMGGFSPIVQNIVAIFMVLSGINFVVYFCLLSRQLKEIFHIEEVRVYLLLILAAFLLITWDIRSLYPTLEEASRHSFFQISSIITTTGYATTDFDLWPQFSKTILLILMFTGACSGSTAGGIKITRIILMWKTISKELLTMIHPRMVKKIKMDNRVVPHEVIRSTNVYIAIYAFMLLSSVLLISLDGFGFTTNFTAVVATLNNIGPGFELVGPTQNFGIFSTFSKYILMFDMLAGRLELFPLLILFVPACWKKY